MSKKERIPAAVRNTVWLKYIDDKNNANCFCCKLETITNANWHCGHIVSEKNGGKVHIDNLRPICAGCNCSMGKTNMFEFMEKYGFDTIANPKQSKTKKSKKTKKAKKPLSEKQLIHLANMREKAKQKREEKKIEKEKKIIEENLEQEKKIEQEQKIAEKEKYKKIYADMMQKQREASRTPMWGGDTMFSGKKPRVFGSQQPLGDIL